MLLYYGGFFTYKDNLVGYNGQDYMGIGQFLFLGFGILIIILLSIFLRNISHKKIDVYLKIMSFVIPGLELLKITIESICDIQAGHGFNFTGLLPLYTCSLFIYTLPLAAFGKGKVKEISLSFLSTMGIFAGMTNFIMSPILNTYPFFNFHTFISLNFHFWMVFTGVFLLATRYYVPKNKDIIKGMIPVFIISIFAIPIDYILKCDYMLLYYGNGAPILPSISKFFADIKIGDFDLRILYTITTLIIYVIINIIIVLVIQLITKLINNLKNEKRNLC